MHSEEGTDASDETRASKLWNRFNMNRETHLVLRDHLGPAGDELRLPEEPERHGQEEHQPDHDLVEGHGSHFLQLLLEEFRGDDFALLPDPDFLGVGGVGAE